MGCRAHVQTKHEIEYGNCHFNWAADDVGEWLNDNGVDFTSLATEDWMTDMWEWELDKEQLRAIPESAYATLNEGTDDEITADELRGFVKDCLAAPTGDCAHVSWF